MNDFNLDQDDFFFIVMTLLLSWYFSEGGNLPCQEINPLQPQKEESDK